MHCQGSLFFKPKHFPKGREGYAIEMEARSVYPSRRDRKEGSGWAKCVALGICHFRFITDNLSPPLEASFWPYSLVNFHAEGKDSNKEAARVGSTEPAGVGNDTVFFSMRESSVGTMSPSGARL